MKYNLNIALWQKKLKLINRLSSTAAQQSQGKTAWCPVMLCPSMS